MALEDDIDKAITKRMQAAPTTLTAKVYGPVLVPPEKVQKLAEMNRLSEELRRLARELDELIESF